ncbi:hypothetical protein REPUB_Repub04eG0000400 [Reevesia pubescens]
MNEDVHSVTLSPPLPLQETKRIKSEVYEGFSHVFSAESTHTEVYERMVNPMVEDFLRGKSGMLAALGPTGSGKTQTVFGSPREPDMVPLALQRIFKPDQECSSQSSSRSQCMINIRRGTDRSVAETDEPLNSAVLSIVDLVGAERDKRTGNQGARLAESNFINSSMVFSLCLRIILVEAPKESEKGTSKALSKFLDFNSKTWTRRLYGCIILAKISFTLYENKFVLKLKERLLEMKASFMMKVAGSEIIILRENLRTEKERSIDMDKELHNLRSCSTCSKENSAASTVVNVGENLESLVQLEGNTSCAIDEVCK